MKKHIVNFFALLVLLNFWWFGIVQGFDAVMFETNAASIWSMPTSMFEAKTSIFICFWVGILVALFAALGSVIWVSNYLLDKNNSSV